MEKIVKRLFLGGTLLVALAVSFTALSTYADGQSSAQTTFKLSVPEVLELKNPTSVSWDQASVSAVNEKNITAGVSSNRNFVLKINAAQPNLVNTTATSDPIPATNNVEGGKSGWGIKVTNNGTVGAYKAVSTTAETFYTGAPTSSTVNLPVGIGISPTQAYGTYSTTVTLTLAAAQ